MLNAYLNKTFPSLTKVQFNIMNLFFNIRLYSVGHKVKDHLDSGRETSLPTHWLLLKGFFYMHHLTPIMSPIELFLVPASDHEGVTKAVVCVILSVG